MLTCKVQLLCQLKFLLPHKFDENFMPAIHTIIIAIMPCQQVSVRRYQWTLPPQSYHLLLCNNGVHDLSWVVPACHDHVLKQHYPTQLGCGNILCFSGVQFHLPYQSWWAWHRRNSLLSTVCWSSTKDMPSMDSRSQTNLYTYELSQGS